MGGRAIREKERGSLMIIETAHQLQATSLDA